MCKKSQRYMLKFTTHSPEETQSISKRLAEQLGESATLLLSGDLGAGKTTFVKGLAAAWGIDPNTVISPTFMLIREHAGTVKLIHADAYRCSDPKEFLEIGLEEYLRNPGVVIIEWGEKLKEIIPDNAIEIHFEMLQGNDRQITIRSGCEFDL